MWRLLSLSLLLTIKVHGAPVSPPVPVEAQPSPQFDVHRATQAWLRTVPSSAKARSDAYFEGGYWLILWDYLWTVGVAISLLESRLSTRMRDAAERITGVSWLQSFLYLLQFAVATAILSFPLTVYESFFREHQYGLSNQTFEAWFRDQLIGFVVAVLLGGGAFVMLVAVIRHFRNTWHLWGGAVAILFTMGGITIGPVLIAPLFNTYTPLKNTALKDHILSLAQANGIAAQDVYQVDASRQSKRVSANVSGFLGTERITLNDNLLNRCSSEAVMAVMGHEMGHYVLHHICNGVIFYSLMLAIAFAILRYSLNWTLSRWGTRWHLRGSGDTAILPLAVLILTTMSLLFIPIGNTFTRAQEYEADIFGLNAARQPDGEAEADLLLGEYRKLDPSSIEEFLFFDHPSGRTRIYAAMRWKAQNLCLFDASLPCGNRGLQ